MKAAFRNPKTVAIGYALAAAVFYAVNIPCSKRLLETVAPTYMAAFLYLGAGIGVGVMYLFNFRKEQPAERLTGKDLPYTVGMLAGAGLVVQDTLLRRHQHVHAHYFVHTHDGSTHMHKVIHNHAHDHYVSDDRHGHRHSEAELRKACGHI